MFASEDDELRGTVGFVEGFIGGVAADEPRAALIGRDILSAGGHAADAAVAMYFTLAVTMPSSASLGGGGVCLVHDMATEETQVLDFIARAPRHIPSSASRPSAVPGNPRGFFALHARYGVLRWEELTASAGNMARFGTLISRALSQDLTAAGPALRSDPSFMFLFSNPESGEIVREGSILKQPDLSAILGQIVSKGPGDFYGGNTARLLVDSYTRAGGSLSMEDLRSFKPVWREVLRVDADGPSVILPQPPASAGAVFAAMWHMMTVDDLYADSNEGERSHILLETAMRAFADRGRWMLPNGETRWSVPEILDFRRLEKDMTGYQSTRHTPVGELSRKPLAGPENPSGTTFLAVDREGNAVVCALSMNNLFGTGRVAPGTGIVMATIPGTDGRGAVSLVPAMVIDKRSNRFLFAGAANGGVAAPTALMNVLARAYLAESSLRDSVNARRVHHGGAPDVSYVESGLDPEITAHLRKAGHAVTEVPAIGRVNAFLCFGGLPEAPETCDVAHDPRGFGLSYMSEGL